MSEPDRKTYSYKCHTCDKTILMYHAPGSLLMDIIFAAHGWTRSIFFENPYRIFCPDCTAYRRREP